MKKSIGELAEYATLNFKNDSMAVSTGLDIILSALESMQENLIVQQEGLHKIERHGEARELDVYLDTLHELHQKIEMYSRLFDITEEEEDLDFLDSSRGKGKEH